MAVYTTAWSLTCVLGLLIFVSGDIIIQGPYDCGRYEKPVEVRVTTLDEETIHSQSTEFYQQERNCIVTIIGKLNYQLELTLTQLDVDAHAYVTDHCKGLCCTDFLKIYNSYRVDNARLLPGISQWGICGTELPRKTTFQTTQNYVTIQFKTDNRVDFMRGFQIRFRQYPWRNPGQVYPDGGYFGGWNDGTKNELRMDWTEQPNIPGDFDPGSDGSDQDTVEGGVSCYQCFACKYNFFDPQYDYATERKGCYVCSKRWTDGIAQADRACYSPSQYLALLSTLIDPSTGSGKVTEYRGCRRFMNSLGEFINYCFCDDRDLCNGASLLKINMAAVICILLAVLFNFKGML